MASTIDEYRPAPFQDRTTMELCNKWTFYTNQMKMMCFFSFLNDFYSVLPFSDHFSFVSVHSFPLPWPQTFFFVEPGLYFSASIQKGNCSLTSLFLISCESAWSKCKELALKKGELINGALGQIATWTDYQWKQLFFCNQKDASVSASINEAGVEMEKSNEKNRSKNGLLPKGLVPTMFSIENEWETRSSYSWNMKIKVIR